MGEDDDDDETKVEDTALLVVLSIAGHSWAPVGVSSFSILQFDLVEMISNDT